MQAGRHPQLTFEACSSFTRLRPAGLLTHHSWALSRGSVLRRFPGFERSPATKSYRQLLGWVLPPLEVRDQLNLMLKGWAAYFSYGTRRDAYEAIDHHVHDCVRHFLRRRHKVPTRGNTQFSFAKVFGELGVFRLRKVQSAPRS
jgi:hypothetical protein